jgi:SAM-dependent methyltransferase
LDIDSAIEYDKSSRPDVTWDGSSMPFEDDQFDAAFATEVLEHCPEPEIVLSEVSRVLKPGGLFFFTVPFLWNLHEVPHDEYRYTPFSLRRHLERSGFTDIAIYATGGWHAAFAQMMGLWVRRSGISRYLKLPLSYLFLPAMKLLLYFDRQKKVNFEERDMITGLYGTARSERERPLIEVQYETYVN